MKMKAPRKVHFTPPNNYLDDLRNYLHKMAEAQILNRDEKFRNDVLQLRRDWAIPDNGFADKTACQYWFEKPDPKILGRDITVEQIEKEIIHTSTQERIVKQWIPVITKGAKTTRAISKFPIGSFLTAVNHFLVAHDIDDAITEHFFSYLYYGKLVEDFRFRPIVEVSERLVLTKSGKKVSHLINLTIGPNTRQKDVLNVWSKYVEPVQKKLPGHWDNPTRER